MWEEYQKMSRERAFFAVIPKLSKDVEDIFIKPVLERYKPEALPDDVRNSPKEDAARIGRGDRVNPGAAS
jgi:hypothetical protein